MKNANQVIAQPDQPSYYNAVQLVLPIDVEYSLDKDDALFSFVKATERINFSKYVDTVCSNNTRSHSRSALLKTMLFAFMNGEFSLSKISSLCKTDLRYMYLSEHGKPSKMAFSRMCESLSVSIDNLFFTLSQTIAKEMGCDLNTQYIDGTKIEANANKNSFVYKKRIVNARDRLYYRITESVWQLNSTYGYSYPMKATYCAYDMWNISQYLMEVIVREDIDIVYGIGKRKSKFQSYYDIFLGYALKLEEYEEWLEIMNERNSCSKVDHDATFMNTKFDYYNNTGLTRACYNCQIAVSNGIIVNSELYQLPNDQLTYQPFMERYKEYTGTLPTNNMGDAGYGSFDNYIYNIKNGIHLTLKYAMYGKDKDKKYLKKKFEPYNWKTDEEGYKICPDGRVLNQYEKDVITTTRQGNLMIKQIYSEERKCEGCPLKKECIKYGGAYKRVGRNVVLEELYAEVDKTLGTPEGIELKKQRRIQVEGAFGVIKQNFGYTRFHRKGMKNTRMEFLLVCLGYNLRKYHLARIKEDKKALIN